MKRIVIADDSATARMFIRRCLEIVGCGENAFIEVENGKEALDCMKKEPADIVVADLNMPVMDVASIGVKSHFDLTLIWYYG